MAELFNYDTSWLNPALKLLNTGLFILVAVITYRARASFEGRNRVLIDFLIGMAFAGAAASLLRYFGHGTEFGFTKAYSLKWFQSLGYVIQGLFFILAGNEIAKGIAKPKDEG